MAYVSSSTAAEMPTPSIRIRAIESNLNEAVSAFAACNERIENMVERLLGPQPPSGSGKDRDNSPREVRQGALGGLEDQIADMRTQMNRYMTALDKLADQV